MAPMAEQLRDRLYGPVVDHVCVKSPCPFCHLISGQSPETLALIGPREKRLTVERLVSRLQSVPHEKLRALEMLIADIVVSAPPVPPPPPGKLELVKPQK